MSSEHKEYWISAEHREELRSGSPSEALERVPAAEKTNVDRRDFLKWSGFAIGAGAMTGCVRGKERDVVPALQGSEELVPGRATWYASVCGACPAGCGVLARVLDGRPIKLEGNSDHPISRGGLCSFGQASVLGLYDSQRLFHPVRGGQKTDWASADEEIRSKLLELEEGAGVRFVVDSTAGPSEVAAIEAFLAPFENAKLVTYDSLSLSAISDAHEATHGVRSMPHYRFDRAEVIVSLGADFLGTWISPVEFTKDYQKGRSLHEETGEFSEHIQIESRMSVTGSNADRRVTAPAGSSKSILAHLADRVARDRGVATAWNSLPDLPIDKTILEEIGRVLLGTHRGRALVVCGDNDLEAQRLVNFLNELLGSYGAEGTIELDRSSAQRRGSDSDLLALLEDLESGAVQALFLRGVNPVYDLPFGDAFASAMENLGLVVSVSERLDETSSRAQLVCPEPHFLESWGDSEAVAGVVAVRQPVLKALGETRPLLESLGVWSGEPVSARNAIRGYWRGEVYSRADTQGGFDSFWNQTLHDGWAKVSTSQPVAADDPEGVESTIAPLFDATAVTLAEGMGGDQGVGYFADLHASAVVFDGRHAHNAWLLELPDPVSKTTWSNHVAIAVSTADELGIKDGDLLEISGENGTFLLPAVVQPGQDSGSVALALGWGRMGTDRFTKIGPQWLEGKLTVEEGGTVGERFAGLIDVSQGGLGYASKRVTLRRTGEKGVLASTQQHHSLFVPEHLAIPGKERRPIVRETTLAALPGDSHEDHGHHGEHPSLYPVHEMKKHHWGLAIDLTACTGCSACVIGCQAENNVPVVGRDEVERQREMHWMRIDRYYADHGDEVDVVHMPMLCQHCDNAPCENVCPVQATVQSAEGLNQQVYNRCVGTRYCANNCPYKVRRFNWFDYPHPDELQNLVFNPDVVVRSRGVMEKCSLCAQRIQEGKAEAKAAGVELGDGSIEVACAQSCPADAIVFGDSNDPESRLSKTREDQRHYLVLEELGVKPVVGYLAKVRNRTEQGQSDEHS